MNRISIRTICFVGMFTAITSVLSILQIPTPWGVPFTLQTFAMALAGYVLWYASHSGTLVSFDSASLVASLESIELKECEFLDKI